LVTAPASPAYPEWLVKLLEVLGTKIGNFSKSSGRYWAMRDSFLKAAIPPRRDLLLSPNAPLTLKNTLSTGGKDGRLYRGSLMGLSSDEFAVNPPFNEMRQGFAAFKKESRMASQEMRLYPNF